MLKNLLKRLTKVYPFTDFLYILQLEEYETKRYLRDLKRLYFKRDLQKRDKLVITFKIKVIFILSLPLSVILPFLIPLNIAIANILVSPFFEIAKLYIRKKAKLYFERTNKNTKVIAIAGSFGKTTTKNYIYNLIRYNFKTQMIPGNINTPAGIAKWILKDFDPSTQILLVEVDTYFKGEIKRSLEITPPDISILTNVGDQHLERLGSKENLRKALYEVFDYAKPNAIKIKGLKNNIDYAIKVANLLHIPTDILKDTIKKLETPNRRGNVISISSFEVIDNSYNISETTAKKSIQLAKSRALKKKKKLLTIVAGIPELGSENRDANYNLGILLDKYSDIVFGLESILIEDVLKGIKNKQKISTFKSMQESLKGLSIYNPKKYIVLMLPELNDLYY